MKEGKIFYWCAIIPLLIINVHLYSKCSDHERGFVAERKMHVEHIDIMAQRYTDLITQQSIQHMAEIVEIEDHHKREIEQCVEYYGHEIERAKQQVTAELSP